MKHILTIKPAVPPKIRHHIEKFLEELGYKWSGGGQATDGSFSSISFEREDPRDKEKEGLPLLGAATSRKLLDKIYRATVFSEPEKEEQMKSIAEDAVKSGREFCKDMAQGGRLDDLIDKWRREMLRLQGIVKKPRPVFGFEALEDKAVSLKIALFLDDLDGLRTD